MRLAGIWVCQSIAKHQGQLGKDDSQLFAEAQQSDDYFCAYR